MRCGCGIYVFYFYGFDSRRLHHFYSMSIVNQIQIYEDVLSPDLVKICLKKLSQPKWGFVGGGLDRRFWHMEGLEQDPFFSEDFFGIIQMLTGRTFLVERIYANGQTACQDGISHVDNDRSDAYTFVYFPNPVWDSSHGGNLLFMDLYPKIKVKENLFLKKYLHQN